jgi:hypothetical protein
MSHTREEILQNFQKKHGTYTVPAKNLMPVAEYYGISTEGKSEAEIEAEINIAKENE